MLEHKLRRAPRLLEQNLDTVARVSEWSRLIGIEPPKKFSRYFQRYYGIRPQKAMKLIRLKSVIIEIRRDLYSNFKIAKDHSIPDEISLNKFTKYHLGYSPTEIKNLPKKTIQIELEKIGSNFR